MDQVYRVHLAMSCAEMPNKTASVTYVDSFNAANNKKRFYATNAHPDRATRRLIRAHSSLLISIFSWLRSISKVVYKIETKFFHPDSNTTRAVVRADKPHA